MLCASIEGPVPWGGTLCLAMFHETWIKKDSLYPPEAGKVIVIQGPQKRRQPNRCFSWAMSLAKHFMAISSLDSLQKRKVEWETEVPKTVKENLPGEVPEP